jgi:hypothetical protein
MTNPRAEGLVCPICKSKSKPLDIVGDYIGFDCEKHGKFKVAGTVWAIRENYTPEHWEAALRRAMARPKEGEWPLIKDADFI